MQTLSDEFEREKNHTIELNNEHQQLILEFNDQSSHLLKDRDALNESLTQCKRLNELQVDENSHLKKAIEDFKKENQMLTREIRLLNDESSKLRIDNDELRNSCIKLDKLIYGSRKKK